ncbi:hypothetical protein M885DRAFT_499872 [Pelagophyceae sp. CCMP2097]|nr:hypothetical protein M885DRAFT_499872 [Pelagophyceae sp. CCMP2097]
MLESAAESAAIAAVRAACTAELFSDRLNEHRSGLRSCYAEAARLELAIGVSVEGIAKARDVAKAKAVAVTTACDAILCEQSALRAEAARLDTMLADFDSALPESDEYDDDEAPETCASFSATLASLEVQRRTVRRRVEFGELLFADDADQLAQLNREYFGAVDRLGRASKRELANAHADADQGDDDAALLGAAPAVRALHELLLARVDNEADAADVCGAEDRAAATACASGLERAFCARRAALLRPRCRAAVSGAAASATAPRGPSGAVAIIAEASRVVSQICAAERALHAELFGPGASDALDDSLTDVAAAVHVGARALILRMDDLEHLRAVVDAAHALRDPPLNALRAEGAEPDEPLDDAVAAALSLISQDTQERATFAALAQLRNGVESYTPTDADLDAASRAGGVWYAPLTATIETLVKLHGAVDGAVFDDFLQHALLACLAAIHRGAAVLRDKRGLKQEAHLFAIKHLLVLRERLKPFATYSAGVTSRRLDWTGARGAFAKLADAEAAQATAQRGGVRGLLGRFFAHPARTKDAVLGLARGGMPTVDESTVDARRELEAALKAACVVFVVDASAAAAATLSAALREAAAACPGHADLREASRAELARVKAMKFAQPAALGETLRLARREVDAALAATAERCAAFLDKPATRRVLLKPVRGQLAQTLADFRGLAAVCFGQRLPRRRI